MKQTLTKTQRTLTLAAKCIVILSALAGVILSAVASSQTFMGGKTVFMYFTIQSNIAIALICLIGLIRILQNASIGSTWYIVKFVGTVAITLTGAVFCFVLAPTLGANAWNPQNILTHVVVPIVAVLDFFLTGTAGDISKKSVIYVTIPPILYAIYAGIGYVLGWQFGVYQGEPINYPYFFLNWGSPAGVFGFTDGLPYMGTGWWILLLLVLLIVVGLCYLFILDALKIRSLSSQRPH